MAELGFDRSRAVWWGLGAALGLALGFVFYSFVGTFVFGLFVYYATRPLYVRLRRRVGPPSLAAALSLLLLALPAVLLLTYTLAIGLQELDRFSQRANLGPLLAYVEPYLNVSDLVTDPTSLLTDTVGLEAVRATLESGMKYLGFIGTGLLHLFVMFALAFYLLRDGGRLAGWLLKFTEDDGVMEAYGREVDRSFHNIFFGNILNAIITGTIGAISYSLLNILLTGGLAVPYPALTGLLAGVASLVPVVGMKLVYVPVLGYLGTQAAVAGEGWGFVGVFFVVSFVVVDSLPDFVLRPYVSGRNLHVGSVMFAYIFGPLLFGWYGIFLGPIILVLVVHFARIVMPELLAGTPIRPETVEPGSFGAGSGDAREDPRPHEVSDGGSGDAPRTADEERSRPAADGPDEG